MAIQVGDLFTLGEHRLLCGDAEKSEDFELLMNNQQADMMFTDPPYGEFYLCMSNSELPRLIKIFKEKARKEHTRNSNLRPNMKPVDLIEGLIRNSSQVGDIVLDCFAGSGSTLIAAHNQNRVCYAMEISPIYCQLILDRFYEHTGIKPKRVDEERMFTHVAATGTNTGQVIRGINA